MRWLYVMVGVALVAVATVFIQIHAILEVQSDIIATLHAENRTRKVEIYDLRERHKRVVEALEIQNAQREAIVDFLKTQHSHVAPGPRQVNHTVGEDAARRLRMKEPLPTEP